MSFAKGIHLPATPFEQLIRPRLLEVSRPAQYIGEEPGMIKKDWDSVQFRFALGFPDLYEIGMSYYGREVLYQRLNALEHVLCERTFVPDRDMEALIRETGAGLWALESKRPLREFDAIGISFTYELAFPSGLAMIDLAGIPLRSPDRADDDPIVIAGGQCMCNPEPIAPFFDVVVNGEGEEVLEDIVASLIASRGNPRSKRLLALTSIVGCYVPSLYEQRMEGAEAVVRPIADGVPARIQRRYIEDFALSSPPVNPVQSYIELPSDKAYLEVMRGCPQGCRFCQAGFITRPARARTVKILAEAARQLAHNTGTNEIGLMSLSTLDHPEIMQLIQAVKDAVPENVSVGLPSLRADHMGTELAQLLRTKRETSLTIAVEAGSNSMRRAINKGVTDDDVVNTFDQLMAAGWHKFKLYFMCGFAGEPDEAMDDIANLVDTIFQNARANGYRKPRLNISVSVLVPKPHTPFQWQAMEHPDDTLRKQLRLKRMFKRYGGSVAFRYHDSQASTIETLLCRGGRELADVVEAVYRKGQTLLSDHFDWDVWKKVLEAQGIDLEREVYTERAKDAALPWDHISRHVGKKFLQNEWEQYHAETESPACHVECISCGVGCGTPLFDADSNAVPDGLKEYYAAISQVPTAE